MEEQKNSNRFEQLVAAPAALAGLVDYQKGAVVSKTLIAKKTGTVTLFAFDAGQGLSEHSAPFDATVCVLDGEAEMTVSGKPFRVRAGEIAILPANDPHAVRAIARFKMLLIMIRS
jgi:quercetin dioxygenase-like cupin family protein